MRPADIGGSLETPSPPNEVKVEALGEGRWKAVFVPRNSMLRGLVESLSVEGKDLPEKAELNSGNGAVSRIAFEERGGDAK